MTRHSTSFRDAVVVITGASRGLGLALARALGRRGAKVAMIARDREALDRAAQSVRSEGGVATTIAIDVADPNAAATISARTHAALGPPRIVIHAASTLGALPMPSLADTEPGDLAHTFAVNVFAPFAITRALLGALVLGGGGVVVDISSDAAIEAYAGWGAYGASKAALDQLGRIWGAELAEAGVRVLSIDPGEMDTQMHADALPDADRSVLADPAGVAERILAIIGDARVPSGARVVAASWEAAA